MLTFMDNLKLLKQTQIVIASFPSYSQIFILEPWRKIDSCEIKSGSGLGMRPNLYLYSNKINAQGKSSII